MPASDLTMFFTFPSYEYVVPTELKHPGETRWRVLDMEGPGFFVAALSFPADEHVALRTMFFTWDSDLVHMIESQKIQAVLQSLHYVCPAAGHETPFETRTVSQVWRGLDRDADNCEVIIFETISGFEFCGQEAIPVPHSVVKVALIANVPSKSASVEAGESQP